MKILHINSNYDRTTLHQAMMDRLAELCDNRVFVPTHDRSCGVLQVGDNVTVCECFQKWDRLCFPLKQKKIMNALEKHFRVTDFELLHAYTLFTDGNVAYKLHKKYAVPYVVAVRNTDVNAFFKYRPHLRGRGVEILRNAAAVFFLSDSYRALVMENYVPKSVRQEIKDRVHVIPNGIDDFWFRQSPTRSKPERKSVRLVFAGSVDKNKNILTLAEGCEILRERGYAPELTVIGRVVDQGILQKLRAYENVTYLPPMSKEELAEHYRSRDIFTMLSFYESFGLVYAEAMSQGLPVVYSRGQGFDGQFPEGTVGCSADSSSPGELADAVEKILQRYDEISMDCPRYCEKFRWEQIVREYTAIYRECLK